MLLSFSFRIKLYLVWELYTNENCYFLISLQTDYTFFYKHLFHIRDVSLKILFFYIFFQTVIIRTTSIGRVCIWALQSSDQHHTRRLYFHGNFVYRTAALLFRQVKKRPMSLLFETCWLYLVYIHTIKRDIRHN